MDYDLIVVKTLERVYKNYYYIIRGDVVTKNMPLMTIEAMKMETTVVSTVNGTVDKIYVEAGDSVHQDDLLVSFHIKE